MASIGFKEVAKVPADLSEMSIVNVLVPINGKNGSSVLTALRDRNVV